MFPTTTYSSTPIVYYVNKALYIDKIHKLFSIYECALEYHTLCDSEYIALSFSILFPPLPLFPSLFLSSLLSFSPPFTLSLLPSLLLSLFPYSFILSSAPTSSPVLPSPSFLLFFPFLLFSFSPSLVSPPTRPVLTVRVSPAEVEVPESQGSVEVCLEARGELEIGNQFVATLSTSDITATGVQSSIKINASPHFIFHTIQSLYTHT